MKENLQQNFDDLEFYLPIIKRKFAEILMCKLTSKRKDNTDLLLLYSFLNKFSNLYYKVVNQDSTALNELRNIYLQLTNQEKIIVEPIINESFEEFRKYPTRFDYELDIDPTQRFLLIEAKIPFDFPATVDFLDRGLYPRLNNKEFENIKQEYKSLIRDKNNENILSIGIDYSYANIILPKCYDIIFDYRNRSKFWEQKVIVKYAYNYRDVFHMDLWRGHSSHCIIEIIGKIPDVFNELPINGDGADYHKGIGICTKYDWEYINKKTV